MERLICMNMAKERLSKAVFQKDRLKSHDFVLKCARAQLARRIYLHIRLETL
jgi:hypothetical protein